MINHCGLPGCWVSQLECICQSYKVYRGCRAMCQLESGNVMTIKIVGGISKTPPGAAGKWTSLVGSWEIPYGPHSAPSTASSCFPGMSGPLSERRQNVRETHGRAMSQISLGVIRCPFVSWLYFRCWVLWELFETDLWAWHDLFALRAGAGAWQRHK